METTNFAFFEPLDPLLFSLVVDAEADCYQDSASMFAKLHEFAGLLLRHLGIASLSDSDQYTPDALLNLLRGCADIDPQKVDDLERLWKEQLAPGNPTEPGEEERALAVLKRAHDLTVWYVRRFHDPSFEPKAYVPPVRKVRQPDTAESRPPVPGAALPILSPMTDSVAVAALPRFDDTVWEPVDDDRSLAPPGENPPQPETTAPPAEVDEASFAADLGSCLLPVSEALGKSGESVTEIHTARDWAVTQVKKACEPFKLGVVGEARSGKSTLVNALVGDCLAFVDVTEATALPCLFRFGPQREARFHLRNGKQASYTVEIANDWISKHRGKTEWLSQIEFVEYRSPSRWLRNFEIWDSPGLGGCETNEEIANQFLQRIGGALWVFDAQLLGQATLTEPIKKMRQSGKRLLAILNRIDGLKNSEEVDAAVEFVRETYSGIFEDVLPISAKNVTGSPQEQPSEALQQLRKAIEEKILRHAEGDRQKRIRKAAGVGLQEVLWVLRKQVRRLDDQLGLYEHIQTNLLQAKAKIMRQADPFISKEAEQAFLAQELEAQKLLDEMRIHDMAGSNAPVERTFVESILEDINRKERYQRAWEQAAEGILQQVEALWMETGLEAIRLSDAAVPIPKELEPKELYHPVQVLGGDGDALGQALGHGIVVGGGAGICIGVIAALSVSVAWPAMIAAIPIGFLAGYGMKGHLRGKQPLSIGNTRDIIQTEVARQREHLRIFLQSSMPARIDAILSGEVKKLLTKVDQEIFAPQDRDRVQALLSNLKQQLTMLESLSLRYADDNAVSAGSAVREHPIVISPDGNGNRKLEAWFTPIVGRLDMIVPHLSEELGRIVALLRPTVRLRMIVTALPGQGESVKKTVRACMDPWTGQKEIRILLPENNVLLPVHHPLFIGDGECLVADAPLSVLGNLPMRLDDFQDGNRAAERLFAELWTGSIPGHGRCLVQEV